MKTMIIIRDGWGYRSQAANNAIHSAKPKFHNFLIKNYPHTLIKASGKAVGLPEKFQGNSEVGHMTIGSGRIILQSLEKINKAIDSGDFFKNTELLKAMNISKKNDSCLHLMGLFQTEGVHSHLNHLEALIKMAKKNGVKNLLIHCFTDGRDAPVTNSLIHIKKIQRLIKKEGIGLIATITGRYYAMDRDKRWERTKIAYENIVLGKGEEYENPIDAIKHKHESGETDEFIKPLKYKGYTGIKDNDSIIFFNYRTDRTRQLTQAIVEPQFTGFARKKPKAQLVAMTKYYESKFLKYAFSDSELKNILGEVISKAGMSQLRISETEKYAHVTFFMNGQNESPYPKEERVLIPSPKIATYDLLPEMSAPLIADELAKIMSEKDYDFIAVNLVNCDMVGHTGKKAAIIKAVKAVDDATQKITLAGLNKGYAVLIFADHGNAEDQRPEWITSHTINPVPIILASEKYKGIKLKEGRGLCDIAPTVLKLLGLKKPKEMTGKALF